MEPTLSTENSTVPARNFVKVRVLLFLKGLDDYARESREEGGYAWRTISNIAHSTKCLPSSLYVIIPRWDRASWGYVDAQSFTARQMSDSRPHTLYSINSRGLSYLKRLDKWYPYVVEAKAAVRNLNVAPFISPYGFVWSAYPGSEAVITFRWPFVAASDAAWSGNIINLYQWQHITVSDIKSACNMCQSIYGVHPTQACIDSAFKIQKYIMSKAGYEFKGGNAGK